MTYVCIPKKICCLRFACFTIYKKGTYNLTHKQLNTEFSRIIHIVVHSYIASAGKYFTIYSFSRGWAFELVPVLLLQSVLL